MQRTLFAICSLVAVTAGATPTVIDRVVAVVNSEIILLSEVRDRAAQMGQQPAPDERGSPIERQQADKQLRQLLERMVEDALTLQQAAELKLAVEEAEIDRAIDEVKHQNKLEDAQFQEALSAQGYTIPAYRKDLRKQLLRLKVVNTAVRARISITEEEIKAAYEQSVRQAGAKRQARVRHILIGLDKGSPAAEVERRRRIATRVLEEAREGKDFAELARLYSDDAATRATGGDLGWFTQGDALLPEAMADVVFSMDTANETRGPLATERGFEVVQLMEKKDGDVRPFREVKDQLRQQLYATQIERQTQQWVGELRKKAHVDLRL